MADDQYLAEPAARHMHEQSLWQRLAAPKDADTEPEARRVRTEPAARPSDPSSVAVTRDPSYRRKKAVARLITVAVVLSIPALVIALLLFV